ncbi:MAG: hypothetical protein JST89_01905 [Cyanobacteria bacterium SZAS-4]|nr:hypothetical protein [Cyanobacteria bacterium SZAS-4]
MKTSNPKCKTSSNQLGQLRDFSLVMATIMAVTATLNTSAAQGQATVFPGGYKVSQPYSSGNLSLFLIKGVDKTKNKQYLTLPEAIAKKQVVVHETGDVNVLKIDNLSNAAVFIQSGEIVKGGRQDRALQSDMLIPPRTQNLSLPCFCVEHGRWSQRVGESSTNFESANNFVVGNSINKAIKQIGDQGAVWEGVLEKQGQLSQKLTKPVASTVSPSSLQLTLEQKNVKDATEAQYKALADTVNKEKDAIGYAVAINGKINNADVYGSGALFRKLWPGLLRAAVTEAAAQRGQAAKKLPTGENVQRVLAGAEHFKRVSLQGATNGTIGPQVQDATVITGLNTAGIVRAASPLEYFSQTNDSKSGAMIHQNFFGQ